MEKPTKKTVWTNIFRLILPYRKKFGWVVILGLLSTGVSLLEPLIYREAINDVAGLFVKQARENAQKDLGIDPEEEESIRSMIRNEVPDSTSAAPDSTSGSPDSTSALPDSANSAAGVPAGSAATPAGSATTPAGSSRTPAGSSRLPAGSSATPAGSSGTPARSSKLSAGSA